MKMITVATSVRRIKIPESMTEYLSLTASEKKDALKWQKMIDEEKSKESPASPKAG